MRKPPENKRRPTIKEVAKLAGVSFKTVARVVNGEAAVSPGVREVVEKAMQELGYSPNVSARQLRSHRSFLIALVGVKPANEAAAAMYLARAQPGALRRCSEAGYHLIFEQVTPEDEIAVVERLEHLRVDGVIVSPPLSQRASFQAALKAKNLRHVLVASDLHDGETPVVKTNDRLAARQMTQLLIKLGHRKIGFIRGDRHYAGKERLLGFLDALDEAGIPRQDAYVAPGDFSFRAGEVGAKKLLQLKDPPTAIFAGNDEMALGTLVAAARLGINVPDQLSVAGYDDSLSATVVWPQLTTVRQPISEMAALAVDLLLDEKRYGEAPEVNLDSAVIKRGSTAKPVGASSRSKARA
jgi:LacI family transcriptional regulator